MSKNAYGSYRKEFDHADRNTEQCAVNGHDVGSGFDCTIRRSRRKGEFVALVRDISGNQNGMTFGFLEPDTEEEMLRVAREIASCPADIFWCGA